MLKKITLLLFFIVNIKAFAATYYVDASKPDNSGAGTSWATAKKDIQNAIDLATAGDQVWVKAGVYYPNARPNMTEATPTTTTTPLTNRDFYIQLKTGVTVFGGFNGTETTLSQRSVANNPTYIDGDIGVVGDKSDNCYHLMIGLGTYSTSGFSVDGLVFRNANSTRPTGSASIFESTIITANGSPYPIQRRVGGGIYLQQGLNNFVYNCVFENNECENRGPGVYFDGGFGLTCSYSVYNCYFVNNHISQSTYGAMSTYNGKIYCYNSVFHNNSVGNFQYGDGVALTLMRGQYQVVNCTFTNNQSYSGSAVSVLPTSGTSTDTAEFFNCIFYGTTRNPSFVGTSGYDIKSAYDIYKPIVKNCALMHPIANYTAANYNALDATSSNNLYEQVPNFSDIANIKGTDGKYFTADDGLALMVTSPLKNTGLNSLLPVAVTTDITGGARTLATTVDMGAYEVDGVLSMVTFQKLGAKIYPNPTNGILTLEFNEFENSSIKITDINSRVIQNQELSNAFTTFDVSNLSAGIYFLQINSEKGTATHKFIKK